MTTTLRLLTLALFTSSAFGLTECKKDTEPEPDKRSQREKWLTSSGWRMDSFAIVETTAAGVVTTTNYPLSYFDTCGMDDLDYYHSDKSFTRDEGLLKCSTTYPWYLTSGTWAFASDETELGINPDQPGATPDHIKSMTDNALTLVSPEQTYSNGITSVEVRTYSAH